jgi:hypothetical protein
MLPQDLKQTFGVEPKVAGRQFLGVLLGLPGVEKPPAHQLSSVVDLLSGSFSPLRIDSRIPGIERRWRVSWMLRQSSSDTKTALFRLPVIWTGTCEAAASSTS